jgi:hypothetical protein
MNLRWWRSVLSGSRCRTRGLGLCGRLRGFGCFFLRSQIAKMFPRQFGVFDIERARVRLFIFDADLRQEVDEHLGLDLEFPRQLVDTNLIKF